MSNLYHLESDKHIHINLDSPRENLLEQQQRLQKLSAAVMRDLEIITEAVISQNEN